MITLRTLGAISLTTDGGREVDGLLRQPKRLALLIYLACPHPGIWHRRESLLGVFWPEFHPVKARTALRNALYVIRQELGPDVLRTRGDEEVSVDPGQLVSDAGRLRTAFDGGLFGEALALALGEFLPGFHVNDAAEFERWLDDERARLHALVANAASGLSRQREEQGDPLGAAEVLRQILELKPTDELTARRLMTLLARAGDRGQALSVFDRLQQQLRGVLGTSPSAETTRLHEEIRALPLRAEVLLTSSSALPAVGAPETAEARNEEPALRSSGSRRWKWRVAAVLVLVLGSIVGTRVVKSRVPGAPIPTTLLVLPMVNATEDGGNDYIATGLAEDVAQRLSSLKTLTIRSAAQASWAEGLRDSIARIGPAFGARVVLRSRLTRAGDSLLAEAQVVDVTTGYQRDVAMARFAASDLRDAGSRLAAAVAGAVFRVPLPEVPRLSTTSVNPEAYRLTLMGWHSLLLRSDEEGARRLFLQATQADPMHARAWSGLSSTWAAAAVNGRVPFEEGFVRGEAAAMRAIALDSLQGTAWANLGVLRALMSRNAAAGQPYFERAIAAEPANPEIYMVQAATLRFASQWERARDAIRIARQLDPLTPYYVGMEANGAMCAGEAADALRLYREQLALDDKGRDGYLGVARSLARLGRWDDAIAQLRVLALSRGDTALARRLASSRGEAGYWASKHLEGEALLRQRLALGAKGWIAPYLIGVAEIGAGHLDRGLDILESEVSAHSRMVYKLSCNPEIDEVRATPRFQALLRLAGALPLSAAGNQ